MVKVFLLVVVMVGLSKPVELEEVEPQVHEPVEETQNKSAAPLLDDDDIKKPVRFDE